jgi:ribonuclease P protein component
MKQTETLKKNYQFSLVYKKGIYHAGRYMTLYTLYTNGGFKRIGITVSRKVYKKSTERNRLRRLIKESFRQYDNDINQSADMIFVVRKSDKFPEFADINREMKYLLIVSGLLKE